MTYISTQTLGTNLGRNTNGTFTAGQPPPVVPNAIQFNSDGAATEMLVNGAYSQITKVSVLTGGTLANDTNYDTVVISTPNGSQSIHVNQDGTFTYDGNTYQVVTTPKGTEAEIEKVSGPGGAGQFNKGQGPSALTTGMAIFTLAGIFASVYGLVQSLKEGQFSAISLMGLMGSMASSVVTVYHWLQALANVHLPSFMSFLTGNHAGRGTGILVAIVALIAALSAMAISSNKDTSGASSSSSSSSSSSNSTGSSSSSSSTPSSWWQQLQTSTSNAVFLIPATVATLGIGLTLGMNAPDQVQQIVSATLPTLENELAASTTGYTVGTSPIGKVFVQTFGDNTTPDNALWVSQNTQTGGYTIQVAEINFGGYLVGQSATQYLPFFVGVNGMVYPQSQFVNTNQSLPVASSQDTVNSLASQNALAQVAADTALGPGTNQKAALMAETASHPTYIPQ